MKRIRTLFNGLTEILFDIFRHLSSKKDKIKIDKAMLKSEGSVKALKKLVEDYNAIVDNFSMVQMAKNAQLTKIQKVSNDFLERTRINCEALIPLLEIYEAKDAMIQPIGLIIRSTLADFLTFCYLVSFTSAGDEAQDSLQNELHILERDFLRSMLEVGEIESKLNEYNPNIPNAFESVETYQEHLTAITNLFSHLYINEGGVLRIKTPSEFRQTSNPGYCDTPGVFENPGSFVTEKYKWQRMVRRDFGKYVLTFSGFKFFSQFQHYSKMSMEMIRKDSAGTLFFHLTLAINAILIMTDFQIQLIDGNDGEFLKQLRELEEQFDDVIGED
jgi:hypothetical protein